MQSALFTPRRISALPGLAHKGDPRSYPGKDEMGDYLERYAACFSLPVVTGNGVARLVREQEHFLAELDDGDVICSRAVVIATGAFQCPHVPGFAGRLAPHVLQLDVASYRNPAQISGCRVLIVGDGATGRQIALELVPHYSVMLATGRRRNFGFQRLFGADTTELALIFATGYGDDTTWVDIPRAIQASRFVEDRGISPVPGLHYVGRDWQTSRASGLVCGVAQDAEAIGARLAEGAASA